MCVTAIIVVLERRLLRCVYWYDLFLAPSEVRDHTPSIYFLYFHTANLSKGKEGYWYVYRLHRQLPDSASHTSKCLCTSLPGNRIIPPTRVYLHVYIYSPHPNYTRSLSTTHLLPVTMPLVSTHLLPVTMPLVSTHLLPVTMPLLSTHLLHVTMPLVSTHLLHM